MKKARQIAFAGRVDKSSGSVNLLLIAVSLCALTFTFFLNYAVLGFASKLTVFSLIAASYSLFCVFIYYGQKSRDKQLFEKETAANFDAEAENLLFALEEAGEFFGASLKPADMFRLVSSRIRELLPFEACVLMLAAENKTKLRIAFADGKNSQFLKNLEFDSAKGNAGKTFSSGETRVDESLSSEKEIVSEKILSDFRSAAAVPLFRGEEVFGVLQLYGGAESRFDKDALRLLEAIGERVAPLFVSSMAFQQSISNALTDSLTALPNERAFFLVLETQIAESTRFQLERPLSVLAIDLKNFTELNQRFGHAAGDRVLSFAGDIIKTQLRQMDFLARSSGDEFLVVLPTASEKVTVEITERIKKAFITRPFEIAAGEKIYLHLNFGAATFGKDGETAQQLLNTTLLRKQQGKSAEMQNVLWFPKEFVN
jgi:diguanylate cyclase (GGDEF)-like protein